MVLHSRAAALVFITVLIRASGPASSAEPSDELWDPHFGLPGPVAYSSDDRRVNVIEIVGDQLYIGGAFDGVTSVLADGIARWNGAAWEGFAEGLDGDVSAILVEGSTVYAAGSHDPFSGVGAVALRWDGSGWAELGSLADIGVGFGLQMYALIRYGGDLYVGGWKQVSEGGTTVPVFARWNGSSWIPISFSGTCLGGVCCMLTDGPYLYLGGSFDYPYAIPPTQTAIFRWDGSSLTNVGEGLTYGVSDLELFNGQVHAVGAIEASGNTQIRDMAAWNGTNWREVGDGINGSARAAAAHDGILYVAGDFDQVGGVVNSSDLAAWDGSQWHSYTGPAFGASGSLYDVAANDDNVYACGYFTNVGGTISYGLGRWDGTVWHNLADTDQYGANTVVRSFASDDQGGLYAGGEFAYVGNTPAVHVAFFDGNQWKALGSGLTGASSDVWALACQGNELCAGGRFTNAGGVNVNNLARWDGVAWHDVGGGVPGLVMSLYTNDSDLYVGGQFTTAGPIGASKIARWDGTSWHALGEGTNGDVLEMIEWSGYLVAGGNFTSAGGAPAAHVAAWDGTTWTQVGAGLNGGVNAFGIFNGDLYATGGFSNSGGTPMTGIAKWDGASWNAVGAGLGGAANDLKVVTDGLFVCGPFKTAGGASALHIAKWDGTTWQPLGTGAGNASGIKVGFFYTMAVVDNYLYLGGDFYRGGNTASACIARWNDAGMVTGIGGPAVARAGLETIFPNPFNPLTTIRYRVAHAGRVTIRIYDVAGRLVRTLTDRDHPRATEEFALTWDGRNNAGQTVASGLYFCRMQNLGFNDSRKLVLLK